MRGQRKIRAILIAYDLSHIRNATLTEDSLKRIRQAAPGAELIIFPDKEEWKRRSSEFAAKVDVVFGHMPDARIQELPNLRWMQQISTGSDWLIKFPEIAESDLILTNDSGARSVPMAEHILALMLTLSRGIQVSLRRQVNHIWDRSFKVTELNGATLGLIGVGTNGEKMAEKAKAMNMQVFGLRRHPDRSSPYVDRMYGPEGLMDLLSRSDWVVITAALTPETKEMIGEMQLKVMKESAYIINVARGSMIQQKALVQALNEGWIAGAGLDVFEKEPLPEDSPLWDMENVVITPHCAAATPYRLDRVIEIFCENLSRYQVGDSLINVVNKRRGY